MVFAMTTTMIISLLAVPCCVRQIHNLDYVVFLKPSSVLLFAVLIICTWQVLVDEDLAGNAEVMGARLRSGLADIQTSVSTREKERAS